MRFFVPFFWDCRRNLWRHLNSLIVLRDIRCCILGVIDCTGNSLEAGAGIFGGFDIHNELKHFAVFSSKFNLGLSAVWESFSFLRLDFKIWLAHIIGRELLAVKFLGYFLVVAGLQRVWGGRGFLGLSRAYLLRIEDNIWGLCLRGRQKILVDPLWGHLLWGASKVVVGKSWFWGVPPVFSLLLTLFLDLYQGLTLLFVNCERHAWWETYWLNF